MPPKVQDTHPQADQNHALEEETSRAARRIVATYAQDFLDGVTPVSYTHLTLPTIYSV